MPTEVERSVLHVLPHPGGGGETYVDLLDGMSGYRFERAYLASSPKASALGLARCVVNVMRRASAFDLVHVHGEVASALCVPVLVRRPSVVTLHGLHLVRRVRGARRTAAALSLRAVLRAADQTICVSESEHAELGRAVGAKPAREAIVIRNGVRLPPLMDFAKRAMVRNALGVAADDVVAIWVGSLDERKDPLAAARAAEEANVTLLVVGDGPLRASMEFGKSRWVRVLGQRDDVSQLLAASDVFVLTSQREGLSFSLLEAMAHGLAPVVTDLPENREAVGDAGIVVPVGDRRLLRHALRRTAADTTERIALGGRARERVGRSFDVDVMVRRTRTTYDRLT